VSKWSETPEQAMRAPEKFIPDVRLGRSFTELERENARRELARIREAHFGFAGVPEKEPQGGTT
jgi:hypothetical protein